METEKKIIVALLLLTILFSIVSVVFSFVALETGKVHVAGGNNGSGELNFVVEGGARQVAEAGNVGIGIEGQ